MAVRRSKKKMRVVTVEVVEENTNNPSDRTAYRLIDEEAEKFMVAVKKAGIKVNFEKMF